MKQSNSTPSKKIQSGTAKHPFTEITYRQLTDTRSIFLHCLRMVILYGEGNIPSDQQVPYQNFIESAYGLAEHAKVFGLKLTGDEIGPYLKNGFREVADGKQAAFKPKEPLLQDLARSTPFTALEEIFDRTKPYNLMVDTVEWLTSALTNTEGCYTNADDRFYLIWFYEWLQVVCFSTYCMYIQTTLKHGELNPHLDRLTYEYVNYCNNKNGDPVTPREPSTIIKALCSDFDISHARTELWEWLDAGISNSRFYTKKVEASHLLDSYQSILTVVQCAYTIANPEISIVENQ